MGVSIESKSHNCDLGFAGFNRFRNLVAEKISIEFGEHYKLLTSPEVLNLYGEEHKKFYAEYDAKTNEFIKKNLPVIIINKENLDYLPGFIDKISQSCVFLLDEFEKMFENTEDQSFLLPILDGYIKLNMYFF